MATVATLGRAEARVQPQDRDAEASVLGAILLDQAAITRVLDFLAPDDFYRENNAQIYRAALNLFREGEPIDNVTLAAELEKLGVLERIGGRAHLALIQEAVPTAANVEHYARIVKDKAYKRRLIAAGGVVTALGFDDSLDATEAVNQAQAHVYAISDDKVGSGMERLYELLKPAMDRIDAQMASGGGVIGIPSGFHDIDRMTNGFKASDLIVVAGRPSMGKALALDTPLPTPRGWTTMGRLRVGDQVFDERGYPCTVTYATPVQEGRDCYEVVFSNGERIVADADHQWWVLTAEARQNPLDFRGVVLTTRDMLSSVRAAAGGLLNYSIPLAAPLRYPRADLPLDPYILGTRLAEGSSRIPRCYQQASVAQRTALLEGLMDTVGGVDALGHTRIEIATKDLGEDVDELVTGLGLAPRLGVAVTAAAGADQTPRWQVRFELSDPGTRRCLVEAIVRVDSVPVRCIQVDSPNHLYLAGRGCIPTHNTSFALNVALHAAVEHKKPVAIFSLEMSKEQLVERMLCEQARIDAQRLHRGMLSDVEYERLAGALGPLGDAPIFIDDAPVLDDLTMRLKARQARSREGIELIVLDYLQLMHGRSGRDDTNRVQEVSAISRSLKAIARELRIPVIAISQLSRAPEARPDKRPILSDLRECVVGSTRLVDATTGRWVPIKSVPAGAEILGVDAEQKIRAFRVANVWSTGVKPVFKLGTSTGRCLVCTANHPLLTPMGWRRLADLSAGDTIASALRLPAHGQERPDRYGLCRLLGYLVGDGSYQCHRGSELISADPACIDDCAELAEQHFPLVRAMRQGARNYRGAEIRAREIHFSTTYDNGYGKPYGNPPREWLRELGVFGQRECDKRVPDWVFEAGFGGACEFLAGYLATDGCVTRSAKGRWSIRFDTTSLGLARDVVALLSRLGAMAFISKPMCSGKSRRPVYRVKVGESLLPFLAPLLPVRGQKGRLLKELMSRYQGGSTNPGQSGLPREISSRLAQETRELAMAGGGYGPGHRADEHLPLWRDQGKRMRRDVAAEWAARIGDENLWRWATGDLLWEEIVNIEPAGEAEVFDISVPGCGNFLADGIVAHNSGSIEQDSDLVMFLYRDEYYNREKSDKPGIAEVLIAKHRNGPTGMVELVFRKELTRFENLERRRPEAGGPAG